MTMIVSSTNTPFSSPRKVADMHALQSFNPTALPAVPQRLVASTAPVSGTVSPQDQFSWSKALALPAYSFGAAAASVSALSAFADRFPAGGVTINPGGIVPNPEWTRYFAPESPLGAAQPILAAFSAGICLVRGALELNEGMETGDVRTQLAGALDLGLAAASALQIASPGVAGAAGLALIVARGLVEARP